MAVRVRTTTYDDVVVVDVCGVLDLAGGEPLRERFSSLLRAGHTQLVADLTDVTFIDSTGLGVLVGTL